MGLCEVNWDWQRRSRKLKCGRKKWKELIANPALICLVEMEMGRLWLRSLVWQFWCSCSWWKIPPWDRQLETWGLWWLGPARAEAQLREPRRREACVQSPLDPFCSQCCAWHVMGEAHKLPEQELIKRDIFQPLKKKFSPTCSIYTGKYTDPKSRMNFYKVNISISTQIKKWNFTSVPETPFMSLPSHLAPPKGSDSPGFWQHKLVCLF